MFSCHIGCSCTICIACIFFLIKTRYLSFLLREITSITYNLRPLLYNVILSVFGDSKLLSKPQLAWGRLTGARQPVCAISLWALSFLHYYNVTGAGRSVLLEDTSIARACLNVDGAGLVSSNFLDIVSSEKQSNF